MKNNRFFMSLLLCGSLTSALLTNTLFAAEAPAKEQEQAQETRQVEIAKLSEAFGHLLGKNLGEMGIAFDIDSVIKGLKDASAGANSPMNEKECIEAITAHQKVKFEEMASKNLKQADDFLKQNAKNKGICALEKGKVQYKIVKSGKGEVVKESNSPLVRYVGKYLDGSIFGSSKEDELLSLDEIIPGLRSALIGMKEGEKREIYIHPELAYGTHGYLAPNSLLNFEIEIVKANVENESDKLLDKKITEETNLPLEEQKSVR